MAEELGDELVLLFAGAVHEDECAGDPDFAACRALPGLVLLGAVDDEAAARLILTADVGIVPFKVEEFNDAALPYRIIKYARARAPHDHPAAGGRAHVGRSRDRGRRRAGVRRRAARARGRADAPRHRAARRGRSSRPRAARTRRCGSGCGTLGIDLGAQTTRAD